jgi:hypothetical protein
MIAGTQVVDGVARQFETYVRTGAANDPLLLRLLNQKSVVVTMNAKLEDQSWWEALLFPSLMFVPSFATLIIVLLVYRRIKLLGSQRGSRLL